MKKLFKNIFKRPASDMLFQAASVSGRTKEKEAHELDFWINVWNKKIVDRVIGKNGLDTNDPENISRLYDVERMKVAKDQLSGLLWMAKKPEGYLDGKIVVEIGPGCCCGLDVSNAKMKILVEPVAEAYRDNGLLLKNNDSALYLTCGSEKIPIFGNYVDVVIASNSLDHVEDINASVAEFRRILKPGGEFFLNLEINHEPTVCEPFALKYNEVADLFSSFETVFMEQTKNPDGRDWVRAVFKKPKA